MGGLIEPLAPPEKRESRGRTGILPVTRYREGHRPARLRLAGGETQTYGSTMLDWNQCPAVERIPGKVGGAWLFRGTRVPVRALFENLEGGARVDDFLEWFPGVTREQVDAVLEHGYCNP